MGEPFAFDGLHDTLTPLRPALNVGVCGAKGVPTGVTVVLGGEEADVPALVVCVTLKLYAVPLVSPTTLQVSVSGPVFGTV